MESITLTETQNPEFIPKKVFIVPYRNRPQHKFFFSKYMSFILEETDDYEILFSHQCDARTFNRGAAKNIGFIAVKNKYPQHYKDITLVFNDVDTIPFTKIFDYETTQGVVKHYYGYKYALGGIVVIKGSDFEKINGYPCYWGWGMEDNALQKRCERYNIAIDRSTFYTIGSPQILQLFDGISRIISKKDPWRMEHDNGVDGLRTISKLTYSIDSNSQNPNDNIFTVNNPKISIINITTFLTHVRFEQDQYYNYDLREPKRKIMNPDRIRETKKVVTTTEDWSNIPYYPTTKEKREGIAQLLLSQGKPVPVSLLQQIEEDKVKELQNDVYNKEVSDMVNDDPQPQTQQNHQNKLFQQYTPQYNSQYPYQQQQNNNYYQQYQSKNQHKNQNQSQNVASQNMNKYAYEYANTIGQKPRATASAKIRLGGVY
jgi:hypothetical protein